MPMSRNRFLKCPCMYCGGHVEFPAEAAGQVVPCPHCGQDLVLQVPGGRGVGKKWGWAMALGAVLVLGGIAVALSGRWVPGRMAEMSEESIGSSMLPSPPPADLTRLGGLACWDLKLERTEGTQLRYLVCRVLNESDVKRYGVRFEFETYDEAGQRVGRCRDYVAMLRPHEQATIRAMVLQAEAATARLVKISEQ